MKFFTKKKKEPNFDDFPVIGGLMVSKMVADKNMKPLFMYREKRSRPEDSGWRIFSGFEPEGHTDNPDNCGIYNPSTILKIDPSIADILLKGVGSVYERKSSNSEWYRVTDYELEDDYIVTHKLTDKWTIEISNLFERTVEENGDLLYTTGDKSIRLFIWNDENKSKEKIGEELKSTIQSREQSIPRPLEEFDFSDDVVLRPGYMIKEADGKKEYNVIYGFNIIDNQVMQVAIYFDNPEDINWAIDTWKKIKAK